MKTNSTSNKFVARAVPPFAALSAFIIACAFSPLLSISAGILALLGGVAALTGIEYVCSHFYRSKMDHYFEKSWMVNKSGELPEVVSVEKTDSGTQYEIRFPAGLSIADIERERSSIEQFIGCDIKVSRSGSSGFINCVQNELRANYEYEYIHMPNPLEICLGNGFSGPVAIDIEAAPHVLIGSETGGGKTTLDKGIIVSLILKGTAELYLADFQKVGFAPFRNSSAVKEFADTPNDFYGMLLRLKADHYKRLEMFNACGVDKIQDYNRKHPKKPMMPRVIIVDEFYELVGRSDIMNELMLRAAEDRKVGHHIIISTQRCSTTIISNDIRSNFPSSIALSVRDGDNSRLIIGQSGAEKLRGAGHALLKHAGAITEFQAFNITTDRAVSLVKHTFVSKEERKALPDATKPKQGPPDHPLY